LNNIPRVISVFSLDAYQLFVHFDNGDAKIYDCTAVLSRPAFQILKNIALFRAVRVDAGGLFLLSPSEITTNFAPVSMLISFLIVLGITI